MNQRELEIFTRIKEIVKLSAKYEIPTGLNVHLIELENLRKSAAALGKSAELEEIDFVYNYLKLEQDEQNQAHASRMRKVKYFKDVLGVGQIVNVRSKLAGNIQAEILGYLSQSVIVKCLTINGKPIIEVNPFDIKT